MSQELFAEALGLSRATLCRYEADQIIPPRQLLVDLGTSTEEQQ